MHCGSSEVCRTMVRAGKSLKSAVDPETIPVHQPLPEPLQLPCPGLLTLVVTKWLPVHMSFLVSFIKGYL